MSEDRKLTRRQLAPQAAALASLAYLGAGRAARAAAYPSQPINFIVPDSGGGSFDGYVRKFSEILQKIMKPSVYVEPLTIPGAGGQAAAFNLLQDKPDGYNMGMINVPGIFTIKYNKKKNRNLALDKLTWVANLGRESYGVAVSTKSDIHNVADLQKRSAQRKVSFSSTGFGSTDYFATRVFASALNLNFNQVLGYTGSAPTMVAVARGDTDAVVHALPTLHSMEASGLIRTIFVFQDKSPLPGIDDATKIGKPELGDLYQWRPVCAPPDLPQEIIDFLSSNLVAAAKQPDAVSWAQAAGTQLYPLDHKDTLAMVEQQKALVDKWAHVLV